jgi:hypothetical protein
MFKFKFAPPKPQEAVNLGVVPVGKCVILKLADKDEQVIVLSQGKESVFVLMTKEEGVYRTDKLSPYIPVQSVVGQFSHFEKSVKNTQLHGLDNMVSYNKLDKQYVFAETGEESKLAYVFGDKSGQLFSKPKDVPTVFVDVFIETVSS